VPVTDHQTATLRAMLAGDFAEHDRLRGHLDWDGYRALIAAGFFRAAQHRFPPDTTDAAIIEFVGSARARSDRIAEQLDPHAAESLIRAVLGRTADASLDHETAVTAQMILLAALIADARPDSAGLDQFLADARDLADEWMS
jgi:hypothetical protein